MALSGHYVEDIAVGAEHTLALASSGDIWSWGSNGDGQLGLSHTAAIREPQVVPMAGKGIKQVSRGCVSVHVCTYCQYFLEHNRAEAP